MGVMKYMTKKGWRYRYKFMRAGEIHKEEGFKTRRAAEDAEAEERNKIKNPTPSTSENQEKPGIPSISFAALAEKHLTDCKSRMRLNTWRAKSTYFSRFIAWCDSDLPIEEITPGMVNSWLLSVVEEHGAGVANRCLKDMKALFNWGILKGELAIPLNPCRQVEPFPEEKVVRYVPPPEDIDAVLMAADQEEMDLLICLYHTGGRIGEIRHLTWDDVNFEKRAIVLWTRKRRGGQIEPDKLAMGDKLHQVLKRRWDSRCKDTQYVFHRKDGTPHTKDGKLRHLMEDLCERAQVKSFGFHAIRHHVASILADSGKATLGQIQRFLRHRRQSTTENYLHEMGRDQREIAEILDAGADKNAVPNPYQFSETK